MESEVLLDSLLAIQIYTPTAQTLSGSRSYCGCYIDHLQRCLTEQTRTIAFLGAASIGRGACFTCDTVNHPLTRPVIAGSKPSQNVPKGPKGRVLVNRIYMSESRPATECERDKIWVTDSIPGLLSLEVRTPRDNHAKFDVHGRRNRYQGHGSLCMLPDVIVTKIFLLCGGIALLAL